MAQAQGFTELAIAIKEQSNKNIWCFTGFLFEDILKKPVQKELLHHIDVLVDGPFIEALKDEQLRFRGSSNQRVIDVKKTMQSGNVILID